MLMSIYMPSIGEVTLYMDSDEFKDGVHVIQGRDNEHNALTIKCSRIVWQDDFTYEYGWVRVVEYIKNGVSTKLEHYTSIS